MGPIVCDICGMKDDTYAAAEWSKLELTVGSSEYEDICGACSVWLVGVMRGKKDALVAGK